MEVNNIPEDASEREVKESLAEANDEQEMGQKDLMPEIADKLQKDTDPQPSSSTPEERNTINNLTTGLMSLYLGDLQKASDDLSELTRNQSILIETIQQENARFAESRTVCNLEDLFARAKLYHTKLLKIKKEMATLLEQSRKLKKRALRLQEHKQKEALQKEYQRERELEREKHLVAKVANHDE